MHAPSSPMRILVAMLSLVVLQGCDRGDDVTGSGLNQQEVESGALVAAVAGPSAEAAEQLILGMIGEIVPSPAPMATGSSVTVPGTTVDFALPSGVGGTVEHSLTGVYTFRFSGTIAVDGSAVAVWGMLVATPVVDRPATGPCYRFDLDVSASGPRASATWGATGRIAHDESGAVVDFSVSMSHTVTLATGPTAVVTIVVAPTGFELSITGPLGNTLCFVLERDTMTGMVSVNGSSVATVAVLDGCAHVDFLNESRRDVVVCAAE